MGWIYTADSSCDWGQDERELATILQKMGLRELDTALAMPLPRIENGAVDRGIPQSFHLPKARVAVNDLHREPPRISSRFVAVGASRMFLSDDDMTWLWTRRLAARVGDTIFVFDTEKPAERPFVGR